MTIPGKVVRVGSWRELVDQLHSRQLVPFQPEEGDHLRSPYVFRGADVADCGEEKPADLDMRLGDRIAFVKLHRRWGMNLVTGLPLWMRSDDLDVTPDLILDRYFDVLEVNNRFSTKQGRAQKKGVDAFGRVTADINVQGSDGQWRRLEAIEWALLRRGVEPKELLHQLLQGVDLELADWG